MALQHLRSSTANKRPTPAAMADGQLAINSNTASPGLFFKDSAGALIKVGPVHVGSTAPNVSPAGGGETGNTVGEQWLDTSGSTYVFKVWDGSAWRSEAGEFVNTTGDTMTGALGIIAGSASTPGLFFSGDANSGLYSPGADQVAISTGGSQRLLITSGGSVGIGTSPASTFHVSGTGRFTATQSLIADGITGTYSTWLYNGTAVGDIGTGNQAINGGNNTDFAIGTRAATNLVFGINTTEKMRLDSLGRLGVGTSSPSAPVDIESSSGTALKIRLASNTSNRALVFSNAAETIGWTVGNGVTAAVRQFVVYDNEAGAARLLIDSSGRVGVGTANPLTQFVISNGGAQNIEFNWDGASTNFIQSYNRSTSQYLPLSFLSSQQIFLTGSSESARIDSSGRLLVGTSTNIRGSKLQVLSTDNDHQSLVGGNQIAQIELCRSSNSAGGAGLVADGNVIARIECLGNDGSAYRSAARIEAVVDGTPGANDMPGRIVLSTTADGASSPTERMRINSAGALKASLAGTYESSTSAYHELRTNGSGDWIAYFTQTTTSSPNGVVIKYTGAAPNNTGSTFLYCEDNAAVRATIRSNGGFANYQANDVNLSDRNAKKDISPAAGTWDCIKEWEIVNYRYKDQPSDADLNLGVIAQQVAESCPEVITVFQEAKEATEDQPAQEERLGVKEQQMYWMAIKALQEAQVRIEQLEQRLTDAGIA